MALRGKADSHLAKKAHVSSEVVLQVMKLPVTLGPSPGETWLQHKSTLIRDELMPLARLTLAFEGSEGGEICSRERA